MPELTAVKILIVDDLPEKHLVYRAVLEEPGQVLVSALSGEEALKALLHDDFAVILLDVNMPGMDGFETASLIRTHRRCALTPIIFITAFADELFAIRGYSYGAVDYILGPVQPDILRTKVAVFVQLFRLNQQVKEQAAAQVALAETEQARLAEILENAADFVGRADTLGRLQRVNRAGRKMLGLDGDASIEVFQPRPQLPDEGLTAARRDGVWFGESVLNDRSGRAVPVAQIILAHKNIRGEIDSFSMLARDISDRKRAEQDLRDRTERIRSIVETAVDAIVVIDQFGVIDSFNPAAEKMFGYRATEVIGRNVKTLMPAPFTVEHDRYISNFLTTGVKKIIGIGREVIGLRKDGNTFPMELAVSEMIVGGRRMFTGVVRNISERKEAERAIYALAAERAQLLESERAARAEAERLGSAKDEFLANLSHELRTPLNAILLWVHLLQSPRSTPADIAEGLEVVARNARIQAQLVADLLEMNRIVSGKVQLNPESVDVNKIISEAVETIGPSAAEKQIQLTVSVPNEIVSAVVDRNRVQQVIGNLLTNAIKFTPNGGRVEVSMAVDGADMVEFEVRDTGIGIAPEFMPHLFERFRQAEGGSARRSGGLGLGLAIVKHLVELHAGTVDARSPGPDQSAIFTVKLPRKTHWAIHQQSQTELTESAFDETDAGRDGPQLKDVRILVVDDKPDAAYLLRRVLEEHEAQVTVAFSAAEAFDQLRRDKPDVLISDIGMPIEDGYSLIRRIRRMEGDYAHLPAVAVTAFARPEDAARAEEAGYQAHITKPLNSVELVRAVAALANIGANLPEKEGK